MKYAIQPDLLMRKELVSRSQTDLTKRETNSVKKHTDVRKTLTILIFFSCKLFRYLSLKELAVCGSASLNPISDIFFMALGKPSRRVASWSKSLLLPRPVSRKDFFLVVCCFTRTQSAHPFQEQSQTTP